MSHRAKGGARRRPRPHVEPKRTKRLLLGAVLDREGTARVAATIGEEVAQLTPSEALLGGVAMIELAQQVRMEKALLAELQAADWDEQTIAGLLQSVRDRVAVDREAEAAGL